MENSSHALKQLIAERTEEVAANHRRGADAFATCLALTQLMDDAIRLAYRSVASDGNRIAVLAIGGYGRAELCPKSDIDVMVLAEDGGSKAEAEKLAKSFLLLLWDAGINVGHSVRTVKDALSLHGRAIDSWASMLESRFLCGNAALAGSLFRAMKNQVGKGKDRWFIEGVFDDVRLRHERFGNSVKLLEPHVKKSAGGLRDFQALFWLYRASEPAYLFPLDGAQPASLAFIDRLMHDGVLDEHEQHVVAAALQFLFRTRHEMHFRRATATDALEYILQREVAEALGFGGKAELHSVEVFMREYYLHARTLHRLYQNLSPKFQEMIESSRIFPPRPEQIHAHFLREDDVLTLATDATQLTEARQVLEAFALCAEHELALHVRLRRAIAGSLHLFDEQQRRSPELASLFRRILQSRRVAKTLHDMNELDVLAAYIPEWGELVAFFQHNMYHYFTADEHTLIAIAKAEHLREKQGVLREVFRNIRRKEVLYITILLHDIAKPRGVADHEVTGVEVARTVLERIEMSDAFPDVAFLIRNHLVMEQVAFRRNIHDPATIKEFAAKFERPELLDYLYVLTYADLSAVNINVWTEWKSSLLQELYQWTSELLRRNLKGSDIDTFKQTKHEETVETLVEKLSTTLPRERVHEHLNGIGNEAYVAMFSDEEIEQHIQQSAADETVSTIFKRQEGYTEVTVIAEDAPFALSKFCAVLTANDANIFDANIFTRDDGIIIDRFRVSDVSTKNVLSHAVCGKIAKELNEVMEGRLDIEHLFAAHRRKWKRRQKLPANPNIRTDVQFEDHPRYTIIDVYAPDALGFLYRVTECISRLGLDIYFAKIATRVDGILDAFYVLDRSGNRITEPERQEDVRAEILATVKQLAEEELAGTSRSTS
jgi:[protein-PII] uridylyltransferase